MTLTPQTDYNDGNWHDFRGTAKPEQVHDESVIEYVWHDKNTGGAGACSRMAGWDDKDAAPAWLNILRFRVTQPYVEPRKPLEFWLNEYPDFIVEYAYQTKEDADIGAGKTRVRCIHLREVTEVSA